MITSPFFTFGDGFGTQVVEIIFIVRRFLLSIYKNFGNQVVFYFFQKSTPAIHKIY